MEAMAGVSGSWAVAGCCGIHQESERPTPEAPKTVFAGGTGGLVRRKVTLRTVVHSSLPSAGFKDRSHVQFYGDVESGLRKDMLTTLVTRKGTTSSASTAAALDERVADCAREFLQRDTKVGKKAEKVEKKMQKRLKKKARAAGGMDSSSSSSSSSESEANETVHQTRKDTVKQLRREWESISRSAMMNSIPRITADFVIELLSPWFASPVESSCDLKPGEGVCSDVGGDELKSIMATRMSSSVGVADAPVCRKSHDSITLGPNFAVARRISSSRLEPSAGAAAGVEVCMGRKCQKAGAQEVLSAFQANGVNASSCNKCMKNCKLAINVRVQEGHGNDPKMYSGVGVEDVKTLSRKYSELGQIHLPTVR